MHIAKVEPFLLSYPLPEPVLLTYYGGERTIFKRDAMLIKVTTDAGRIGWAPGQGSERAERTIRETIAPFLIGRPLAEPDALRVQFHRAVSDPQVFKVYCAVEVALWDLLGQARGLPISELIGGRVRDRIKLYGSGGMYMPPEAYAEEAAAVRELGFTSYKMRPGLGPDEDLRTVDLMRRATGRGFGLMVDAHTWWRMGDRSYGSGICSRMARDLVAFEITWLEEPLPPMDHASYTQLKAAAEVPIASGEHESSDEGFFDLIENDCIDYLQADLVCQGGYQTGRRLFAELEKNHLRFAFHSWGTDLEVLAAAHLGICWPEEQVEWLEYPLYRRKGVPVMFPFDLATEILAEPLTIEKGDLVVPRTPGLGLRVNEKVIEKYPWIPGPWSRFKLISPPGEFVVTSDHSVPWAGPEHH
jgi:L-alanine-DL-glutamate epimerase-like enolase superfamily enzyme